MSLGENIVLGVLCVLNVVTIVLVIYIAASLDTFTKHLDQIMATITTIETANMNTIQEGVAWLQTAYDANKSSLHQIIDDVAGRHYSTVAGSLKNTLSNMSENIKTSSLFRDAQENAHDTGTVRTLSYSRTPSVSPFTQMTTGGLSRLVSSHGKVPASTQPQPKSSLSGDRSSNGNRHNGRYVNSGIYSY